MSDVVNVVVSPIEEAISVSVSPAVQDVNIEVDNIVQNVNVNIGADVTATIKNSDNVTIITKEIPSGTEGIILIKNDDGTPFENYEIIDGEIIIITNSLTDDEGITLTDDEGVILTAN